MSLGVVMMVSLASMMVSNPAAAGEAVPGGLERWRFVLGDWRVVEQRFDFDSRLIQTNSGEASFRTVMNGRRYEELITLQAGDETTTALHVFAWDPGSGAVEIARTDSGHDGFWVIRGTMADGRMDLLEKHPDPESQVTRRITYVRTDDDHFLRRLEFSQDRGASWFVRSEWGYTRKE